MNLQEKVNTSVEKALESFDYDGVSLGDSFLEKQYKTIKDFYMAIPDDSLLYGFRKRAGMYAPGESLGGWYKLGFFTNFGQILSGLSRFYKISSDKTVLEKLTNLLDQWSKTIDPNNFFFYTESPNAPHYIYDKMVGGLVDIYIYSGNEYAISCLDRITRWAEKNLDRTNEYAHNYANGSTEWYTLPENLYRAYVATGKERYKEFGDIFLYNDYFKFYHKKDFKGLMHAAEESRYHRYHAYSHVNTLGSAAMAYYITGDSYYLQIIKNAYEMIVETQLFNSGGYGPCEAFVYPEQKTETLYTEDFHFEVACASWGAFKLVRYLTEFTGSARYGYWSERIIYNGIGAALPMENDGNVMYYANYNIAGAVKEVCNPWSCCTGTYPIDVAEYHNQIYYKSNDGIFVNLFIPSEVNFTKDSNKIKLKQETEFPKEQKSKLYLKSSTPLKLDIGIRIPTWAAEGFMLKINGSRIDYTF